MGHCPQGSPSLVGRKRKGKSRWITEEPVVGCKPVPWEDEVDIQLSMETAKSAHGIGTGFRVADVFKWELL